MLKKVINILKKIILSVLLIYTYNKLALPLDVFVPINIFTVIFVFICGIPSMFVLILYSLICI